MKFGDLDCDGREDLFISTGMSRDWFNSDLRNQEEAIILASGRAAGQAFWDDKPPLALPNWAFRNEGDLDFTDVGDQWGLATESVSYGAALGDLDGDGDLDLVVNNFGGAPGIYRNGLTSGGRLTLRLRGKGKNPWAVGATVRLETDVEPRVQLRALTLSRGFMSSNEPLLHFGVGEAKSVSRLVIDWPAGGRQVLTDLVPGRNYTIVQPDTLPDAGRPAGAAPMFVRSDRLPGVSPKERPFDDFARQPLLPSKHSQLGPGIAIGDVDADGLEDVYVSFPAGQSGRIYQRQASPPPEGESSFTVRSLSPFDSDSASEDLAPLFLDVDGDGDQDLFVVSGGVEGEASAEVFADRLYINGGDGVFTKAPEGMLPSSRDSGSVACTADYDRDGDLDLFVGGRVVPGNYPESPASRLLRNESGKAFTDVSGDLFDGMVTSALWSDADGDGWLDLLVAGDWGPVKYYHNESGQLVERTQEAGLAERSGWWNSLAGGDFDRDGDIDYVAGNVGLNTKYHPPALLFYGDVDGSGVRRILEAEHEGDKIFPIRGLSCSSRAIPFLKEKTPKFHDFASATLSELYADLEQTVRYEANTLSSGVLVNDGAGKFEFRELPALAQVAPVFGIAPIDTDADGILDLYLAQNDFSPQPETGRMDGGVGVLLRGLGDCRFEALPPNRSGLVVAGDARGVATSDINQDSWPDLLIAVNDDEMLVFEQVPPAGAECLAVRFGRVGARVIGSRVTVELSGGDKLVSELNAGGGYCSQSSPILRFAIPAGAVAEMVTVRWSDGLLTQHPVIPGEMTIAPVRE